MHACVSCRTQHVKMSIKLGEKNVIKGRMVMEEEIAEKKETEGEKREREKGKTNAQCAKL